MHRPCLRMRDLFVGFAKILNFSSMQVVTLCWGVQRGFPGCPKAEKNKIQWSVQRRNSPVGLSAPALHVSPGEQSWGHVGTQHPTLCFRGPQGAPEPCGVAIVWVRAVLALIWNQTRQHRVEVALGQGRWQDGAMTLVLLFLLWPEGLWLGFRRGGLCHGHLCSGGVVLAPSL